MDAIGNLTIAIPTALKAYSSWQQGEWADRAGKFESDQMVAAGTAEYAAATRASYEAAREGKILAENAEAAMAGSGGVTTDEGAVRELAEIDRDAQYNSMAALFEGKSKRQDLVRQAVQRRLQGKIDKKTKRYEAIGTLLEGGSELYTSMKNREEEKRKKELEEVEEEEVFRESSRRNKYRHPSTRRIGNTRPPNARSR